LEPRLVDELVDVRAQERGAVVEDEPPLQLEQGDIADAPFRNGHSRPVGVTRADYMPATSAPYEARRALLDRHERHLEHERRVRRNRGDIARGAVGKRRRDDDAARAADSHAGDALL